MTEGPADGHTWRLTVDCRSSSKVVGDRDYADATEWDRTPNAVEVRAWSLSEALRKAADLPLDAWFDEGDET